MSLPTELSSIFRQKQKSYKMVLILTLLDEMGDPPREVPLSKVIKRFQQMLSYRERNNQPVDDPPAHLSNSWQTMTDQHMKQVITNPINALSKIISANFTRDKVQGSVGQGNWATVPWIAIMDRQITDTTQHGEYVVYLFSDDMKYLYLTLNLGVTEPLKKGRREGEEYLRNKVRELRNMLPLENMLKDDRIMLTSSGVGRDYQTSTVAYIRYEREKLPAEERKLQLLELEFYESNISSFQVFF